jgi:hypothetical protein
MNQFHLIVFLLSAKHSGPFQIPNGQRKQHSIIWNSKWPTQNTVAHLKSPRVNAKHSGPFGIPIGQRKPHLSIWNSIRSTQNTVDRLKVQMVNANIVEHFEFQMVNA